MKTFNRICIKDYKLKALDGEKCQVYRGKEYTTSEEKGGKVCVFTCHWFWVPVEFFAGEVVFTK